MSDLLSLPRAGEYAMIEGNAHNALTIGKAAEHLVVADLLLQGRQAFLGDQGLPFDVVLVDRLVRIQVKAACAIRNIAAKNRRPNTAYLWSVRRRGRDNKGIRLSAAHYDIVALVALDIRAIAYAPVGACSETVSLRADQEPGKFGYTMKELSDVGKALTGISSITQHARQASRDTPERADDVDRRRDRCLRS